MLFAILVRMMTTLTRTAEKLIELVPLEQGYSQRSVGSVSADLTSVGPQEQRWGRTVLRLKRKSRDEMMGE